MFECRMLTDSDFADVVRTMQLGFSDYFIDIDIDEQGYSRKFALEGVDFSHSVAAFEGERMIGTTMNGVAQWHGVKTVYDAGTAVVPEYRRKGASTRMFEYLLPHLEQNGFEKYVLEVIARNEPAIGLYEKLGFRPHRKLGVFKHQKNAEDFSESRPNGKTCEMRTLELKDVIDTELFSDTRLTWQNSNDWLRRADAIGYHMEIVGAEVDGTLAGIGAVAPASGKVQRIAVEREFRRMGIGRQLLRYLAKKSEKELIFVNVDLGEADMIGFLAACGCEKTIEQFEMELEFV